MISVTQGDSGTMNLTAKDADGEEIDLTGAVFTTYIKGKDNQVRTLDNSKHTADADQVNNKGKFTLAFLTTDSSLWEIGNCKEVLTRIVQGSSTIYYRGKILNVLPPFPQN